MLFWVASIWKVGSSEIRLGSGRCSECVLLGCVGAVLLMEF